MLKYLNSFSLILLRPRFDRATAKPRYRDNYRGKNTAIKIYRGIFTAVNYRDKYLSRFKYRDKIFSRYDKLFEEF